MTVKQARSEAAPWLVPVVVSGCDVVHTVVTRDGTVGGKWGESR